MSLLQKPPTSRALTEPARRLLHRLIGGGAARLRRLPRRPRPKIVFHKWPWSEAHLRAFTRSDAENRYPVIPLEQALRRHLEIPQNNLVALTGSGRMALRLGLDTLKQVNPGPRRVIVPTYCCGAGHEAVIAAGLVPRYVDIDETLNSSNDAYLQAIDRQTLSVILVNLCGRWMSEEKRDALIETCRRQGVFTIEDNAQCFRAIAGSRPDMEIHSFGFGKFANATAGGMLVAAMARKEVAKRIATLKISRRGRRSVHVSAAKIPRWLSRASRGRYPLLSQGTIRRSTDIGSRRRSSAYERSASR